MDFKHKKALVFGLGESGTAAARLLLKEGAKVMAYDSNASLNKRKMKEKILVGAGRNMDLTVISGKFDEKVSEGLDLTVISPGVPQSHPVLSLLRKKAIPIWAEIELAYVLGKGDVLAVTGTNGKTTTTSLLAEIMKNYQKNTFVAGNIGRAYSSIAQATNDKSIIVLEISSFQLEAIHTFHPKISAILNLSPDHLDRYRSFEEYIQTKEKIAENQTKEDTCVLNYEDEETRAFAEKTKAAHFYFSSARRLKKGIYIRDGSIVYSLNERTEELLPLRSLQLIGAHNFENVMAASAMALSYGVPVDIIRRSVAGFRGIEHRIEFVAEKDGVAYFDDSKGTNPAAAIKGIQAMTRPTFLIAGGYDKGASYEEWVDAFDGKVKKLVLVGETKEKIAAAAKRRGFTDIVFADTFEEAFEICAKNASSGDCVLLSPACASWGMFKNFEERGDKFKQLVKRL